MLLFINGKTMNIKIIKTNMFFQPCFVPQGLQDGVCCQREHPLVGPNGQPVD